MVNNLGMTISGFGIGFAFVMVIFAETVFSKALFLFIFALFILSTGYFLKQENRRMFKMRSLQ